MSDNTNPTPTETPAPNEQPNQTPAPASTPAPAARTFTQEELDGIVQKRLAEDRARRERAATPQSAPKATPVQAQPAAEPLTEDAVLSLMARERAFTHATSGHQMTPQQFARMEAAYRAEKPGDVADWSTKYIADMGFAKVGMPTQQQPSTPAPAATPAPSEPAKPPPTAPTAPVPHALPTSGGLVDIWNLTPAQLDQLGPYGVKAEFEKHKEAGARQMGAPPVPKLPSR